MKSETVFALFVGFAFGLLTMGMLMTHIGPNSKAKVDTLKHECELNIPRNQNCVMQFVPEKK